jgi:hypothetical protein
VHNSKPTNTDSTHGYVILSDPLNLSTRESLPFPIKAASRLAEQRSTRYDDMFFAVEDAESRIRELASIMGMLPNDDDLPFAA